MKFVPPDEPLRLYEEGFGEDILNRAASGRRLSNLVERFTDPLVIALDGDWGSGKTYFLRRWVGAHTLQNGGTASTVYFDAFEHDYLSDPLIGLVAAIGQRLPREDKKAFEKVRSATVALGKPAARIGIAALTYGVSELVNGFADKVLESAEGEAGKVLDQVWAREEGRRSAMAQFRNALTRITTPNGDRSASKPIVVVIDELDRCRPDYALETLEVIKHFFAVPNVHFILGTNLAALAEMVRTRYGAGIDGIAYLSKFISFQLQLPDFIDPQSEQKAALHYAQHLLAVTEAPEPFRQRLVDHLACVARGNRISIRDVRKIVSSASLLPSDAIGANTLPGWTEVMLTLLGSKIIAPPLYQRFLQNTVTDEDIAAYFGSTASSRQETINHAHNPNYDHASTWRYEAWRYVARGQGSEIFGEVIPKLFDSFGRMNHKQITDKAHRLWLDSLGFAFQDR